jgi:hypothetical protein
VLAAPCQAILNEYNQATMNGKDEVIVSVVLAQYSSFLYEVKDVAFSQSRAGISVMSALHQVHTEANEALTQI